jgi:hypothetical protein
LAEFDICGGRNNEDILLKPVVEYL